MYAKVCVLLLSVALCQATRSAGVLPEVNLMRFMMQSRAATQDNPSRSMDCFDYYLPILDGHTSQYKIDYAACLSRAQDSRDNIDDTTVSERDEINASALDACNAMQECSAHNNSLDYFECYTNVGGSNSKSMYTISANSSVLLAQVREQYRLIDVDCEACTNRSDRAYVENTAATYEELNKCLTGGAPVPTPTVATPSTTEPDTSSAAPDTTPEEPETSSAAPDTSSAAPDTSSAAPDTTSEEPDTSSAAPDTSSAAPDTTPEEPETSSAAPDTTTEEPETSSDAPETSEEPAPTSDEPAPTTEDDDEDKQEKSPEEDLDSFNQKFNNWLNNLKNGWRRN